MGCLYCGKEIGPFRLIQDADFCTSAHRKQYEGRLSKGFGQLIVPERKSTRTAGFQKYLPARPGVTDIARHWEFESGPHAMFTTRAWKVDLPPMLTGMFAPTAAPRASAPPADQPCVMASVQPGAVRTRPLALEPAGLGLDFTIGLDGLSALPVESAALAPADQTIAHPFFTLQSPPLDVPIAAETSHEEAPVLCEAYMPSLRAEVAERMVAVSVAGELAYASSPALPAFAGLAAAGTLRSRQATDAPSTGWMTPRAEAAERMVAASVTGALGCTLPVALPALAGLAVARPQAPSMTMWRQHEAAQASLGTPAPTVPTLAPTARLRQPQLQIDLATETPREEALQPPAVSDAWMPVPRPEAAERFVLPAVAAAPGFTVQALLPVLSGFTVLRSQMPQTAEWVEPAAQAAGIDAAALNPVAPALPAVGPAALLRQPALHVEIADAAGEEPFQIPAASEAWMPVSCADAAERMVRQAFVEAPGFAIAAALPDVTAFAISRPFVPSSAEWMTPQAAEPVLRDVSARADAVLATALPSVPALPASFEAATGLAGGRIVDDLAQLPRPAAVESMPAPAALFAVPVKIAAGLIAPAVPVAAQANLSVVAFQSAAPGTALPLAARETGARLELVSGIHVALPSCDLTRPRPLIPEPTLIPMEYYVERLTHAPRIRLGWMTGSLAPALPRFTLEAVLDRVEAVVPAKPQAPKPETKVRELPKTRVYNSRSGMDLTVKIAAGLMFAAFLWLGSRSNFGTEGAKIGVDGASDVSVAVAKPGAQPVGTMARMRQAIAKRASVEMTDSFRSGMQNWGAGEKSWAQGWSHHKDGYVHTGELALFTPSSSYTDYRLEFYGQIENKSMGWVVRAQDKQNYYAMKVSVIEPGLRPVIALAHYPVTGGKKGHRVETPLNVMVHNNRPYHVAVDVRGNRFTASIEGEEVGTWTDESPGSGAIGFFSDAGERARLYWMKVSKNQDWIGKICSYIVGPGDGARTTAEIWGPAIPTPPSVPSKPRPQQVAVTATLESRPAKFNQDKRMNQWNS